MNVTAIDDGYELKVPMLDGSDVEIQLAREVSERHCIPGNETYELFISKGAIGTMDTMRIRDLRHLAAGILKLAETVEKGGITP